MRVRVKYKGSALRQLAGASEECIDVDGQERTLAGVLAAIACDLLMRRLEQAGETNNAVQDIVITPRLAVSDSTAWPRGNREGDKE